MKRISPRCNEVSANESSRTFSFLLAVALMLMTLVVNACSPKTIQPQPFVNDFWKNISWKRYEKLAQLTESAQHKDLRKWLGPKKDPGFRVTETNIEALELATPTTAEVTMYVKYFIENEYVEKTTEVTQTWHLLGSTWLLHGGFPLRGGKLE